MESERKKLIKSCAGKAREAQLNSYMKWKSEIEYESISDLELNEKPSYKKVFLENIEGVNLSQYVGPEPSIQALVINPRKKNTKDENELTTLV